MRRSNKKLFLSATPQELGREARCLGYAKAHGLPGIRRQDRVPLQKAGRRDTPYSERISRRVEQPDSGQEDGASLRDGTNACESRKPKTASSVPRRQNVNSSGAVFRPSSLATTRSSFPTRLTSDLWTSHLQTARWHVSDRPERLGKTWSLPKWT